MSSKTYSLIILLGVLAAWSTSYGAISPEARWGALKSSGSGCRHQSEQTAQVEGETLQIPVGTAASKSSGQSFLREACNSVISMTAPKGHKLVVSHLSAPGFVDLAPGTRAQIQLEIFKAGRRGEQQVYKNVAQAGRLQKPILFEQEDVLFESECGESFNLRSQSSIMLSEGLRKSSASLDSIQLKVETQACR